MYYGIRHRAMIVEGANTNAHLGRPKVAALLCYCHFPALNVGVYESLVIRIVQVL